MVSGAVEQARVGARRELAHTADFKLKTTIGIDDNRAAFYEMFDSWAEALKPERTEVSDADWTSFRSNMYDGEFLLNVDEDFIASCQTPLLVLLGNDLYHPESTSRRIAELAPRATLIEDWKSDPDATVAAALTFLKENT